MCLLVLSVLIMLAVAMPAVSAEENNGNQVNVTYIGFGSSALTKANETNLYNESINFKNIPAYNISTWGPSDQLLEANLTNSDVIFTYMLTGSIFDSRNETLKQLSDNGTVFFDTGSYGTPEYFNYSPTHNNNTSAYTKFTHYFNNKGASGIPLKNTENLLIYLAKEHGNKTNLTQNWTYEDPIIIPESGLLHPDADAYSFNNTSEYLEWYKNDTGTHHVYNKSKPTIGLWMHKSTYLEGKTGTINALIDDLESKDCNVITGFKTFNNITDYYCKENGDSLVQCVISLKTFRLNVDNPEKGIEELKQLDVPVLKGIVAKNSTDPADANRGFPNQDSARKTVLPSLDGIFDYIKIGYITNEDGKEMYKPMPHQIDWISNRAIKWADLKLEDNQDKKVAVTYYNYPPGKDNIGASYLNTMSSMVNLLNRMNQSCYDIENVPNNSTELLEKVQKQGINAGSWAPGVLDEMVNNRTEWGLQLIPIETYHQWFNSTVPKDKQEEVISSWGAPWKEDVPVNKSPMIWENETGKYIVLPSVQFGDVWLMPQPPRGFTQNDEAMYHSTSTPPTHQYIAFYLWLNKEWNADAIIHMGTHGTHEWLPGPAYGMDRKDDWAPLMLQDLPNIYPYIVANVGEGLTAEYRGNALIIDHLTPTLEHGGLHGKMNNLSRNLHTYYSPATISDEVKDSYRNKIIDQMIELDLDEDLGLNKSTLANFRNNDSAFYTFARNELHGYLEEISEENIPYGLHVLGETPPQNSTDSENDELTAMVSAMMGNDFKENLRGAFYTNKTKYSLGIPLNDTRPRKLVWEVVTNNTGPSEAQNMIYGNSNATITSELEKGLDYKQNLLDSSQELDNILSALNAGYIPPGPGTDPIQNTNSVPTGRNFYGVNPELYPSEATWELGKKLAQDLLKDYHENHGEYPRKVSFSRFGVEFIRDHGTLEAEILYLLGVKPTWDGNGYVNGLKLIPEHELEPSYGDDPGRPRIDIVYATAGMRDAFPGKIKMVDSAVQMANNASSVNYTNYVKQNTEDIKQKLIDAGYSKEEAEKIAKMRCFAVKSGTYEIGVANAVEASGTWENEEKIAELYINNMGYAYGNDVWSKKSTELLKGNLMNVDASVHSDSSNLYDTLDNDDFYQYFGGLNLATRYVSDSTPDMYVSDTRNRDISGMVPMDEYLHKNMRSRYFNQEWIEGMKNSGYSGSRMMSKFVGHMWGWEVTNPELVRDSDWKRTYETYVNDPEMKQWFQQNSPEAYQSISGRMIEAIRKGHWKPSDEVKETLVSEYVESVAENGAACCHHTCGNPLLDDYVDGIMSVPGADVVDQETRDKYKDQLEAATGSSENPSDSQSSSTSGGVGSAQIVNASTTGSASNQTTTTTSDGGYGESTQEPTSESAESSSDYVEGYEMTKENPRNEESGGSSFSGADIVGTVLVLAAVGAMYIGFRRRQM
ncbi:cobaltochelatase subunit CobN [Methanohalophilus sp.]